MKAREINRLIENPGYTLGDYGSYIAIGSPLCHDLIRINKDPLHFDKLALDTYNEGKRSLKGELLALYERIEGLMESGKLRELIDGQDEIENPLPVYTVKRGELIKTYTDAYGWPNTTIDGIVMHNNTYFKTEKEAVDHAIRERELSIEMINENIDEKEKELEAAKIRRDVRVSELNKLKSIHA